MQLRPWPGGGPRGGPRGSGRCLRRTEPIPGGALADIAELAPSGRGCAVLFRPPSPGRPPRGPPQQVDSAARFTADHPPGTREKKTPLTGQLSPAGAVYRVALLPSFNPVTDGSKTWLKDHVGWALRSPAPPRCGAAAVITLQRPHRRSPIPWRAPPISEGGASSDRERLGRRRVSHASAIWVIPTCPTAPARGLRVRAASWSWSASVSALSRRPYVPRAA